MLHTWYSDPQIRKIRAASPWHNFNADPDPAFHFHADLDPAFQFNADPDPTFLFNADLDPDSNQCDRNLRALVYRPSRAPFWVSRLPLWASTGLFWASQASEFWLQCGSWSGCILNSNADPDPVSKNNANPWGSGSANLVLKIKLCCLTADLTVWCVATSSSPSSTGSKPQELCKEIFSQQCTIISFFWGRIRLDSTADFSSEIDLADYLVLSAAPYQLRESGVMLDWLFWNFFLHCNEKIIVAFVKFYMAQNELFINLFVRKWIPATKFIDIPHLNILECVSNAYE